MTEDDAYTAILAQLDPTGTGYLPAPYATVPYARQNEAFLPPTDGNSNMLPWVYCEVEFSPAPRWGAADAGLISIGDPGNNLYRKWGLIAFQVFVAVNAGDQLCRQIAASLAGLYQGTDFAGVTCSTTDIREGGKTDDGDFWSRGVIVNFYFDQES